MDTNKRSVHDIYEIKSMLFLESNVIVGGKNNGKWVMHEKVQTNGNNHQIGDTYASPMYTTQTRATVTEPSKIFLPSVNFLATNFNVSSSIMTGMEIFNTADHSATFSGVIWKIVYKKNQHNPYKLI